ncbi:MAG: hypothetical protein A4S14_15420 [Proteobacteria bacterium SG_bin9]|nr:MAG: hypothetical protein A4S14_15420 [Proteobacteria bacterium SG_bin9]
MQFSGERGEFFRLVARGALLEFITVGFYRFWLVTDIRRHLWSRTVVDGDAPEYTGRGRELLIGFLVAMAILAPIYLAYFLVGLEAERVQAFASLPLVAFLYVFGQFAIYRARRYRLSRTVWRGVRFWMSGSGWAYAFYAAMWGTLVVITFGLALPWRDAALERYKMRHSFYGDLQGRFEGSGWEFFKQAWWLWLLSPLAFIPLLTPFIYGAFKTIQWRWWMSGIRFGGVRFESDLSSGVLITLYWKVIGWAVLLMALLVGYLVFAAVLVGSMSGLTFEEAYKSPDFLQSIPFAVATVFGYLATMLAFNVIFRLYLTRDFWAQAATSIRIHNLAAASSVAAKGDLAGALGEGFADGLDVGGF